MGIELLLIGILMILSAFFSGSETALLSANKIRLHHQARKKNIKAKLILETIDKPDQFLATVLAGNNLVNIACASIVTGLALEFFDKDSGILLSTIITTLLLLIFSEILPKTYAAYSPEKASYKLIYPVRFCMFLFFPLTKFVTAIANSILDVTAMRKRTPKMILSEEEIKTLLNVSHIGGSLSKEKEQMLQSVFLLDTKRVKDIFIPRSHMEMVNVDDPIDKILEILETSAYSRIPVFEKNKTHIIGILNVKDFFREHRIHGVQMDVRGILRKATFVPELQSIRHLVSHFQREKIHMAIVVNEYGGIEGLVTLEDALEEIVGEIHDEYDTEATAISVLADGSCLAQSITKVEDVNRKMGWNVSTKQATIGALISDEIDRMPKPSEVIYIENYEITIISVSSRGIGMVKLRKC
ncbi:MAG: DUF21 domain-containing protein [Deltaproteobacteria bacterium]|nr:DUF21 domain-containing protein [Deltaproteobacteria bacterium]